jgi:hypothetical protein
MLSIVAQNRFPARLQQPSPQVAPHGLRPAAAKRRGKPARAFAVRLHFEQQLWSLCRLAKEDPDLFFAAAAERLTSPIPSRGLRFLTRVATHRRAVLRRLASPALGSRDKAIDLFCRLLEAEPSSDIRLAHLFPRRGALTPEALDGAESNALWISSTSHRRASGYYRFSDTSRRVRIRASRPNSRSAFLIRDEYAEVRSMALRAIAQLRCAPKAPAP